MPVQDVLTAVADHTARAKDYSLYADYYENRHYYPYASTAFREKYEWILQAATINMCPAVVTNFTDLVSLESWTGEGAEKAQETAEQSKLRQVLNLTVRESWTTGDGYVHVWKPPGGAPTPIEHAASEVAFQVDDLDRTRLAWAAKVWVSGSLGRVNVYYADVVERWITTKDVTVSRDGTPSWPDKAGEYARYAGDKESHTIRHDFARVPWVHVPYDARRRGDHGRSILRDIIATQDALNLAMAAEIINIEQVAAPLRALMNYQPVTWIDPNTGKPTEEALRYDETRSRILGIKGPGPLTQLDPPDATGLISIMDHHMSIMGRITGIPVNDLVPDLGNVPSGAALRVLARRRTAAVEDFTQTAGPAVSDLMSMMGVEDAYPVWADPAPTDETERFEVAAMRADLGWSLDDNLLEMGRDQDDRDRITAGAVREQASIGREARRAFQAGEDPASVASTGIDPFVVKTQFDALGVGVRAGVDPDDAAERVGLDGVQFTGAVPVSLRLPETDASGLEGQ